MARFPFVLVAWCIATPLSAQNAERVKPGDCFKVDLSLAVTGKLKVQLPGGKTRSEPLEATAQHVYFERIESNERVLRAYVKATSTTVSAGSKQVKELSPARSTIVRQTFPTGPQCFHPEHILTRDELELVGEHFDSVALARLIPANVSTDPPWKIQDDVTAVLCQFDTLTTNGLVVNRGVPQKGVANYTVEGTAEGTELGAAVKVKVKAQVSFGVGLSRVIDSLTWEQEDDRAQGPASPAMELKATVQLKRELLAECPAELRDAARVPVPAKVAETLLFLRQTDANDRYSFLHPRNWHVTGQTNEHLVLRLIEDGDWTAQATILALKPTPDGSHMTPAAFKEAVAKQPGWTPAAVTADCELANGPGRWLYRLAATGKQDGLAVAQSFFCLADANGNQVVVTVVARADRAAKLGSRDVDLVKGIKFPGKK